MSVRTGDTPARGGRVARRVVRGLAWGAGLLGLAFFALRPDRIVVERVVFEGADRASLGELRHMADVENGTTLWSVDVGRVAKSVERHPWVKAAKVQRRWPDALVVQVEERVPRLMASWGGTLYYVDGDGVPFLVAEPDDFDHPLLIGLSEALDALNPKLSWYVLHDTLWLLDALEQRKLVPTAQVAQITFERTRGFTFTLKGGTRGRRTSEILIVPGDYDRQLDHLARVLEEGVEVGAPVRIDVAPPRVALVRKFDGTEAEPVPEPVMGEGGAAPSGPVPAVGAAAGAAPDAVPAGAPAATSPGAASPVESEAAADGDGPPERVEPAAPLRPGPAEPEAPANRTKPGPTEGGEDDEAP